METKISRFGRVISVIEDDPELNRILCSVLQSNGYDVEPFESATQFLNIYAMRPRTIDLVISDIIMPGLSGYELCRKVRAWAGAYVPIILISGLLSEERKIEALDAGADDFISKPFRSAEVLAKVRSLLGVVARHEATLDRVEMSKQEAESRLERVSRFLPMKVTELLTSEASRSLLKPHRKEVTVLFVDLRGFTAFSERTDPDEVMAVLKEYYRLVGEIVVQGGGTIGHLAGDGIMAFFNDPEPMINHREVATRLAIDIKCGLNILCEYWKRKNHVLDFGIGLAEGQATIGGIGFEQYWQYSVIGSVANLASRICCIADRGQILMSRRFISKLSESSFRREAIGKRTLKGVSEPVELFDLLGYEVPENAT